MPSHCIKALKFLQSELALHLFIMCAGCKLIFISFDTGQCLFSIYVFFNVVDVGDDSIFVLLIPKVLPIL